MKQEVNETVMNGPLEAPLMIIQAEMGLMLLCRTSWRRFISRHLPPPPPHLQRNLTEGPGGGEDDYLV